ASTDYVSRSGTLIFNPGDTVRTVKVSTLPNPAATGSRTFALNVSAPTLTSAQGTGTIVYPGPVATSLHFVQQPTSAVAGGSLGTVTVQILDQFGHLLNSNAPVTLALSNNPSGGALSGLTRVNAIGGMATFSGLGVQRAGTGYTLVATSATLA